MEHTDQYVEVLTRLQLPSCIGEGMIASLEVRGRRLQFVKDEALAATQDSRELSRGKLYDLRHLDERP